MNSCIVLGAGQIGFPLAAALLERGSEVTLIRKTVGKASPPGSRVVIGDLSDGEFARSVRTGAAVVFQCANPPRYLRWNEELLAQAEGAVEIAKSSNARLIVLDCLYAYGNTGAEPRHEGSPLRPVSKKGELRKALAALYARARSTGLDVCLVRASDFIGIGMDQAVLGQRSLERLAMGKSVELLGRPDAPHAYTYGPDVVEALIRTARLPVLPEVIHVPTLPAISTRRWVEALAEAFGVPARSVQIPKWLMSVVGQFDPTVRETIEMLYQFESPFLFADQRSRALLDMEPTPFEEQISSIVSAIQSTKPRPRWRSAFLKATVDS